MGLMLWRVSAIDVARSPPSTPRFASILATRVRWSGMGMVQTNAGRAADALAAFQRAAQTDPTSVDAWIGVANAQMNRHDFNGGRRGAAKRAAPAARSSRRQGDRQTPSVASGRDRKPRGIAEIE